MNQQTESGYIKAWQTLIDGWPIFAAVATLAWVVFILAFDRAVDDRIAAALPSDANIAKLRNDIESLRKDLEEGRIIADVDNNKAAIERVEASLDRVESKIDQFILIMRQ